VMPQEQRILAPRLPPPVPNAVFLPHLFARRKCMAFC
jgi:hypothetical protein